MSSRTSYGPDLAAVHHEAYAEVARAAGPVLVRLLHAARFRRGLVVDLGCGSGVLARHLTAGGFDVLGIDPSAAMLRIARTIAPRARFVAGRAERALLPPCHAIVSTGEAITYLTGRQTPAALLERHVRRAARVLAPGGLLVFDAIVRNAGSPMRYRTWREGRDWAVLVDAREDARRRQVTRNIVVFMRRQRGWHRTDETHRVGVYDRAWIGRLLETHGFGVRTLRRYGRSRLGPRRLVFVARRLPTRRG